MSAVLEFRVLGPLEVWNEGRPLRLGGERQRALLAVLLLNANEVVSTDRLIEALFGLDAPPTAVNALQVAISRLRRLLEDGNSMDSDGVVLTRPRGYELRASPEQLDLGMFERLVGEGRRAIEAGDSAGAALRLQEALALWRGPALADLSLLEFAQPEIRRLEELRLAAVMERVDADLALGRDHELVAELEKLVAASPLQERLRGQLMLALYRSGRQAEALAVYRSTRELLADELGLEPSRALRDLERRILEQDPTLMLESTAALPAPPTQARLQRSWALAAVLVLAGSAAVVLALALRGGAPPPVVVKPGTMIRIDPKHNRIVESVPVGREPAAVLAGKDVVWVSNERDATLTRVDLDTHAVETVGGVENIAFLTRDVRGNIYASAWDYPFVWRIDPQTAEVVSRYRVRTRALDMAVSGGSLWVVDRLANAVDRIDLARGSVSDVIRVGADPLVLASGYGAIWVANSDDASVSVIRPGVPGTQTITDLPKVFGIAAGEGAVWAGSNVASTVTRIDPDTRAKLAVISVARDPTTPSELFDVAAGAGAVWAANRGDRDVVRIDPRTNRVVARIPFPAGTEPRSINVAGDAVWVTVGTPGYQG